MLSVAQLNVWGALARDPELVFQQFHGQDIIVLTETWIGEHAQLPPRPGYAAFAFPRPQRHNFRGPRGGVAVYVADHLAGRTREWRRHQGGFYAWLHIPCLHDSQPDLYLAACYFPPMDTRHSGPTSHHADAWTSLWDDVGEAQGLGAVLLAGDFNGRTGTGADHSTAETGDADPVDPVLLLSGASLPELLATPRSSQDEQINPAGRSLLSCCSTTDMRILNGRLPGDLHGAFTCHPASGGHSVVDYFIACPQAAQHAQHLEVQQVAVGFDHSLLVLQLRDWLCLHDVPAPLPPPAATAVATRTGYRLTPDLVPEYQRLAAAPAGAALLQGITNAAAAASTREEAQNAAAQLEGALETLLQEAGMPRIALPRATPGTRRPANPTTRALLRQRRQAARVHDPALIRQLDARLYALRRRRQRQDKAAQQAALLVLARASRSAFWKRWKQRLQEHPAVAGEDFRAYYMQLFGQPPAALQPEDALDTAVPTRTADGSPLDVAFTAGEVAEGVAALKRDKALAGFIKLEYLLPIVKVTCPSLAAIFNSWVRLGCMPPSVAIGWITAIPKAGGNLRCEADYRPITVGTLLAKIYATCLDRRLSPWLEEENLRARGQAGFRHDHRTTDNVFILRTLIELQRSDGSELYCCFVDFKKAYDSVSRELLWGKLESRGVGGWMLQALKTLYADVHVCVRTVHALSAPFPTFVGLRQGCPLSPTLFGVYVDDFEEGLLLQEGLGLVSFQGECVPPLFYADDLLLMSGSVAGLQRQLDYLQRYAARWRLTVNVSKTKAMMFGGRGRASQRAYPELMLDGGDVEWVHSFVYLGVEFHESRDLCESAAAGRVGRAWRSVHLMRKRCSELGVSSPWLQSLLFDAIVRPSLTYGADVWGTFFIQGSASSSGLTSVNSLYHGFFKRLLGVRASTPTLVVLAELGRFPLVSFVGKLAASMWRRLVLMEEERLVKKAFNASLALARQQGGAAAGKGSSWVAHMAAFFEEIGLNVGLDSDSLSHWSPDFVEKILQQRHLQRLRDAAGSKVKDYIANMWGDGPAMAEYKMQPYLRVLDDSRKRVLLAQFRTGSHWLRVEADRFLRPKPERHLRICPHCHDGVEDEQHVIFTCPKYAAQRRQFPDLFGEEISGVCDFMRQDARRVASFILGVHSCVSTDGAS